MADNWIAGATKNKGGLHRSLGVPEGEKIPEGKVSSAASGDYGPKAQKQAKLAQTLGKMHGKGQLASRLGIGKVFKTAFRGKPQAQQPPAFDSGQSTDLTQFQQPWSEWLPPSARWMFQKKYGNT